MNRRLFLAGSASAILATGEGALGAPPQSPLGICIYSYGGKIAPKDTLEFLDHCHSLGAAGIQMQLSSGDREYADKVKARAAEYGMYYEGIVSLPKAGGGDAFGEHLEAAKTAGAAVVRSACLSGRRYETFADLASWKHFVDDSMASVERAVPILEKHKIHLALENHKDWTVDEMVSLLERHQSEYLGVCLDFGNNVSLLDDPDAVAKLAPYAVATHVKDIGVQPYDEGFRMSELPLGEGLIDIHKLVTAVRAARPTSHFSLEMITRDPLDIPCLTDKYWATFPDRNGSYLARALSRARDWSKGKQGLPTVSDRDNAALLRLTDENIKICLNYAREQFGS